MDCRTLYRDGRQQPYTVWCGGEVVKFTQSVEEAAEAHRGAHTGTDQKEARILELRQRRAGARGMAGGNGRGLQR